MGNRRNGSRGEVDTAWRILDAQYWGVPQRRKRIYLVGDFGGQRAGEILFKSESLLGYTPQGKGERKNVAGQSTDGLRTESSRGVNTAYGLDGKNILVDEEKTGTLSTCCGSPTNRSLLAIEKRNVIPLRDEVTRMKDSNGLGVGKIGGPCPTLTTQDIHSVFYEAKTKYYEGQKAGTYKESNIAGSLLATQAKGITHNTGVVVQSEKKAYEEIKFGRYRKTQTSNTLRAAGASCGGGSETIVTESYKTKEDAPGKSKGIKDILKKAVQKITYIIRRLTPVECERLQGYPDNWTKYGADSSIIADTARYRAIGNSICVYCAERVYLGILDELGMLEVADGRRKEKVLQDNI